MEQQQVTEQSGERALDIAVIGCGSHCVHSHLSKMGAQQITLAGVFDPSQDSVDELGRNGMAPLQSYASEEALLLSPAEAVLIMSPDQYHAGALLRAVRANKHVFVEKPLATNSEQLETVISALNYAKEHELVVSSCHPRRFDPPFLWLKEQLPALIAELGPVSHFEFDFSYHKPVKAWKHERGLLLDHINHEIDLVNWYFGHSSFTAWKMADGATYYHVVGKRDDSIHFNFNGSRQLESSVYREFMHVRFQRGTLSLDTNLGEVSIHNHETDQHSNIQIKGIDYDMRFRLVNENFVEAVKGEAKPYLTLKDLYVNTALGVHLTEQEMWRYVDQPDCA